MNAKMRSFRLLQAAFLLAATCAIVVADLTPGAFPQGLKTLALYLGSTGVIVALVVIGVIWRIGADDTVPSASAPDVNGLDRFLPPKL